MVQIVKRQAQKAGKFGAGNVDPLGAVNLMLNGSIDPVAKFYLLFKCGLAQVIVNQTGLGEQAYMTVGQGCEIAAAPAVKVVGRAPLSDQQ
jgi:hypothetical protein